MGLFGLMSRKHHEAALEAEKAAFGQSERAWQGEREDAFTRHSLALAKMGVERDEAVARRAAAEAECARIAGCHVGRVRIFIMPIDALEMTARARAVEGSVRVQWSVDEKALVGDAAGPLTEAQYQGVIAAIAPQFNRT